MKKLLMFLCCVFALNANVAWGAGECPYSTTFHLQGTQRPKDNEFLYTNETVWNKASTDGAMGSTVVDLRGTGGVVYECDQEQACGYGSYIEGGFVHKGEWVDGIFRCHYTIGDDKWTKQNPQECKDWMVLNPSPSLSRVRFLSGGRDKVCFADNDLLWCCSGQKVSCLEAKKRGEPANWNGQKCNCGSVNGVNYTWNEKMGRCDKLDNVTPAQKKSCGSTKHGSVGVAPCSNAQKTAGAKTCQGTCDDGNWKNTTIVTCDTTKYQEKPVNGKCVAKNDQGNGSESSSDICAKNRKTQIGKACCYVQESVATYNEKTDRCVCKNGGKFTLYQDKNKKGGYCIEPNNNGNGNNGNGNNGGNGGNVETPYECPSEELDIITVLGRNQYKDCKDVIEAIDDLEKFCKSTERTEFGYIVRNENVNRLIAECEKGREEAIAARNTRITKSRATIESASKGLNEVLATLKVTVWKDAQGNFNTARLASDSIAGVVLGTAGGLITSHVVKKNQVKTGFEDIQCTVGGQKVADWGDEFTVGIR